MSVIKSVLYPQLADTQFGFTLEQHWINPELSSDNTGVMQLESDLTFQSITRSPTKLEMIKLIWRLIEPKIVRLKPGEIVRVSESLLVEKTKDGKIVLYEVTEEE